MSQDHLFDQLESLDCLPSVKVLGREILKGMSENLTDVFLSDFEGDLILYWKWKELHHCCDIMQGDDGPFIRVKIHRRGGQDLIKVFGGDTVLQCKEAVQLLLENFK